MIVKAAVCREFGHPMDIAEVCLRAPRGREVAVRIKACAICHSDIHYAEGAWGGTLPAVFGHEAAGRITALGSDVSGFAKDDPVLVTLLRSCGECPNCVTGRPARCEMDVDAMAGPLTLPDGSPLGHGLKCAAFAEQVVVDESQIVRIPRDMPMDVASLLSCGVITGAGAAINTAAVRPGASVAVIGVGGVGLNAVQGARICGASRIIAVDVREDKLRDARDFGATDGLLATCDKPHRALRSLNGGRGVDYAFVTVGSAQACQSALRFLAPGGKLVVVGMPPSGAAAQYEPMALAYLSQSIVGSCMGDTVLRRDIPYLIALYRQGRLKLDELVTNRFPLSQIGEAIASAKSGQARRNVIMF